MTAERITSLEIALLRMAEDRDTFREAADEAHRAVRLSQAIERVLRKDLFEARHECAEVHKALALANTDLLAAKDRVAQLEATRWRSPAVQHEEAEP